MNHKDGTPITDHSSLHDVDWMEGDDMFDSFQELLPPELGSPVHDEDCSSIASLNSSQSPFIPDNSFSDDGFSCGSMKIVSSDNSENGREVMKLSDYEKIRAKNIERNNARLRSLGLISAAMERELNDKAWGGIVSQKRRVSTATDTPSTTDGEGYGSTTDGVGKDREQSASTGSHFPVAHNRTGLPDECNDLDTNEHFSHNIAEERPRLSKGMQGWCQYWENKKWYRARIKEVMECGTVCSMRYPDGSVEDSVPETSLRGMRHGGLRAPITVPDVYVGMKSKCRATSGGVGERHPYYFGCVEELDSDGISIRFRFEDTQLVITAKTIDLLFLGVSQRGASSSCDNGKRRAGKESTTNAGTSEPPLALSILGTTIRRRGVPPTQEKDRRKVRKRCGTGGKRCVPTKIKGAKLSAPPYKKKGNDRSFQRHASLANLGAMMESLQGDLLSLEGRARVLRMQLGNLRRQYEWLLKSDPSEQKVASIISKGDEALLPPQINVHDQEEESKPADLAVPDVPGARRSARSNKGQCPPRLIAVIKSDR